MQRRSYVGGTEDKKSAEVITLSSTLNSPKKPPLDCQQPLKNGIVGGAIRFSLPPPFPVKHQVRLLPLYATIATSPNRTYTSGTPAGKLIHPETSTIGSRPCSLE